MAALVSKIKNVLDHQTLLPVQKLLEKFMMLAYVTEVRKSRILSKMSNERLHHILHV